MEIQEVRVQVLLLVTSSKVIVTVVVECTNNFQEQQINELVLDNKVINDEHMATEPQEMTSRRSQRQRRFAISNDYVVY